MKKIGSSSLMKKRSRAGYVFCIPFIIGFIFLFLAPILHSIYFSFCSISASGSGMVQRFIGFDNYYKAFNVDPTYKIDVITSIGKLTVNFLLVILFSFFISTMLNQKFKGRAFARAIFFMPVIISSGVILLMQNDVFMTASQTAINETGNNGLTMQMTAFISKMMSGVNIGAGIISIVTTAVTQIAELTTSSGVQILIFLAGLQTIPPSLYEASSIEGATGWENLWKITLPMISPIILVNAIYTVVDSLAGLKNPIIQKLYTTAFRNFDFGYSAAMGWIYFILVFILMAVVYFIISPMVYYENK
jgi:ABC-type sugar transport system permease subunit